MHQYMVHHGAFNSLSRRSNSGHFDNLQSKPLDPCQKDHLVDEHTQFFFYLLALVFITSNGGTWREKLGLVVSIILLSSI